MNIKCIALSIFYLLWCESVVSDKHCIIHHGSSSKEDMNICLYGKPIDIHIEGSPIQPVINVSINITIIERC